MFSFLIGIFRTLLLRFVVFVPILTNATLDRSPSPIDWEELLYDPLRTNLFDIPSSLNHFHTNIHAGEQELHTWSGLTHPGHHPNLELTNSPEKINQLHDQILPSTKKPAKLKRQGTKEDKSFNTKRQKKTKDDTDQVKSNSLSREMQNKKKNEYRHKYYQENPEKRKLQLERKKLLRKQKFEEMSIEEKIKFREKAAKRSQAIYSRRMDFLRQPGNEDELRKHKELYREKYKIQYYKDKERRLNGTASKRLLESWEKRKLYSRMKQRKVRAPKKEAHNVHEKD